MASIGRESNGHRRILFVAADGSRKAVRVGKCSQRDAEQVCRHVEALAAATIHGQPASRETSVWLTGIGDKLHDRLSRAGLVEPRAKADVVTLGTFIESYLTQRSDVKPGTMIVMRQASRWLLRFMGDDKVLADVTTSDADGYRAFLQSEKRAKATPNRVFRQC
jgi:hypothetical protein